MAPESEEAAAGGGTMQGLSGGLGRPLLMAASFAAGAAAALGTRALLDSRQKRTSSDVEAADDDGSAEDLPTVLRRASLDLAIAATNQAAERLGQDRSEAQDEEAVLEGS